MGFTRRVLWKDLRMESLTEHQTDNLLEWTFGRQALMVNWIDAVDGEEHWLLDGEDNGLLDGGLDGKRQA